MMKVLENRGCDSASSEGGQLRRMVHLERSELLWIEVLHLVNVREASALQVLEEHQMRQAEVM